MTAFNMLLTTNQILILQQLVDTRAVVTELAKVASKMAAMQVQWVNTVGPLVATLDAAVMPDIPGVTGATVVLQSGLSGAVPLLPSEFTTMWGTSIANFLTTYNSPAARALYTKFGGALNVIG